MPTSKNNPKDKGDLAQRVRGLEIRIINLENKLIAYMQPQPQKLERHKQIVKMHSIEGKKINSLISKLKK